MCVCRNSVRVYVYVHVNMYVYVYVLCVCVRVHARGCVCVCTRALACLPGSTLHDMYIFRSGVGSINKSSSDFC